MKYDNTIALLESYFEAINDLDHNLLNISVANLKKKLPKITKKPKSYDQITQACFSDLQEGEIGTLPIFSKLPTDP